MAYRDKEFSGALLYGAGLAATSSLAFAFNALMGRRLSPTDFGTLGALTAVTLGLSGPITAVYSKAAMPAARLGYVAKPVWRVWLVAIGSFAGALALLPVSTVEKASLWFVLASCAWLVVAWNRGLLVGLGHLALTGGTTIFEGLARLGIAIALVARGWGVSGAAAGFALGTTAAMLLTEALLPPKTDSKFSAPHREAWIAAFGLLFISMSQFPDVVAVRLLAAGQAGMYAAASSLARIGLYAQVPAAAYALRRGASVGARMAFARSLALAVGPGGVAVVILWVLPRRTLKFTYGTRYVNAVSTLRVLSLAMLVGGVVLVVVNLMMGTGHVRWAWSMGISAAVGAAAVFTLGGDPHRTAWAMLLVQSGILAIALVHVAPLLRHVGLRSDPGSESETIEPAGRYGAASGVDPRLR